MNKRMIAVACIALTLNACASYPSSIKPAYVSPTTYQALKCEQVSEERARVDSALSDAESDQRKQSYTDTAVMTVGLLVFWPALFAFAFPSGDRADEIARLKGEQQATKDAALTCQTAAAQQANTAKPATAGPRWCAEQPNGAWKCS